MKAKVLYLANLNNLWPQTPTNASLFEKDERKEYQRYSLKDQASNQRHRSGRQTFKEQQSAASFDREISFLFYKKIRFYLL